MLNFDTLEVAIGMAFVFLMMSIICTGIREGIEGVLKWRAMDLERAIRNIFDDKTGQITAYFYGHPLISSLFTGSYERNALEKNQRKSANVSPQLLENMPRRARKNLPSYIPSDLFAKAIIDIVARGPTQVDPEHSPSEVITVELLRTRAAALSSPFLRRLTLSAIDHADGDMEKVTAHLKSAFDGVMDRTSGWYRRRTQTLLFVLGFSAAVFLNVDAFHVLSRLMYDKPLRQVLVSAASDPKWSGSNLNPTIGISSTMKVARDGLLTVGMPIGWVHNPAERLSSRPAQMCAGTEFSSCEEWDGRNLFQYILGWLVTAIAIVLGAPFWFDVLNKIMVIRSTVKPHEKSPEEASEDKSDSNQNPSTSPTSSSSQPLSIPQAGVSPQVEPITEPATQFIPHEWKAGFVNLEEVTL